MRSARSTSSTARVGRSPTRGGLLDSSSAGPFLRLCVVAAIAVGLSACSGAEAGPSESTATPTASATPLPGVTAASIAVGLVTLDTVQQQSQSLRLDPPKFLGLSADEVGALLPPSTSLGGRNVTVTRTEFVPPFGTPFSKIPVESTCSAQAASAVVITDVPSPALVDCLLANGSVVIDASAQPWDTTALNQRAPRLWASAGAPADVAEKVLLAQAQQRGALPQGSVTVVKGDDELLRRVAETVTIPTLTSAGLIVTPVDILKGTEEGIALGPAVDEILDTAPDLVRPMKSADYVWFSSSLGVTPERPTVPVLLVTSNNGLRSNTPDVNPEGLAAIRGLGWTPLRDMPTVPYTEPAPSSPTAAQACASAYPGIEFSTTKRSGPFSLYRWCDAVNLLRIGLGSSGTPTQDSFRDAVWASGSAWNPAAVLAEGWTPQSYTGANQARWLVGTDALGCPPAIDACVIPDPTLIPLT